MIHVEQFKDYYLTSRIGIGGMAEIFRARKVGEGGFEKPLVIKRLLPHLASNEEFRAMFLDEARLASQLSHPNIAHLYDLGRYEHPRTQAVNYFIAMEHVFGKNLSEIRKQAAKASLFPSLEQIARIILGAAQALHYAHFKKDDYGQPLNIVHRDVSPQNILLSYEGEVKLVDFGIAKALTRTQHTQSGVLKGKLAYMAPEQARGEAIDFRADIYSLGVVFWELLTGRRLFAGDSEATTLRNVLDPSVERPGALAPHVPGELEAVCMQCLAVDPKDRCPDAMSLAISLERYLREAPATTGSYSLRDFMHRLFAREIESENALIQDEARAVRSLVQRGPRETDEVTEAAIISGEVRSAGQGDKSRDKDSGGPPSRRLSMRTWALLGAGLLGVCLIVLLFIMPGREDVKDAQHDAATTEPEAPAGETAPIGPADAPPLADDYAQRLELLQGEIDALLKAGNPDQALALLDAQVDEETSWANADLMPLQARVLKSRAMNRMESDPRQALEDLRAATGLHPDDSQTHLTLGRLLTRLGNPTEALRAYEQALALDDLLHEAHYNRGVLLLRQGMAEEAEQAFLSALRLNPPYAADVYVNLAACRAHAGHSDQAADYLKKALEADPDHEIAKHNLNLLQSP